MEEQIQIEYKNNLERIRVDNAQKNKEIERFRE
jgi:hypothetical protein